MAEGGAPRQGRKLARLWIWLKDNGSVVALLITLAGGVYFYGRLVERVGVLEKQIADLQEEARAKPSRDDVLTVALALKCEVSKNAQDLFIQRCILSGGEIAVGSLECRGPGRNHQRFIPPLAHIPGQCP